MGPRRTAAVVAVVAAALVGGAAGARMPVARTMDDMKEALEQPTLALTRHVVVLVWPEASCQVPARHMGWQQLRSTFSPHVEFVCVPRQGGEELLQRLGMREEGVTGLYLAMGTLLGSGVSAETTADNYEQFGEWVHEMVHCLVTLRNELESVAKVFWVNGNSGQLAHTVRPYQALSMRSYPGHAFYVEDTKGDRIKEFTITGPMEVVVQDQTCFTEGENEQCVFNPLFNATRKLVPPTESLERQRRASDRARFEQNRRQPGKVKRFTEVGWKATRIPDDLYANIKHFYDTSKHLAVREAWAAADTFTNHWQSDIHMMHVSPPMTNAIFNTIRPILEEWAGVPKLVPTSCYGIRIYGNGSRLEEHVDRISTHAVSAILQIAQEDVEEPWHLTVLDFNDEKHFIEMSPGDMVLYESASVLHGRPKAFKGLGYANLFVHYKPSEGWTYTGY